MMPKVGILLNSTGEESGAEEYDYRLLVFPFGCLIVGLILDAGVDRFRCQKFSIPSTVFQLTVACFLSVSAHSFLPNETVERWRVTYTWRRVDPDVTLLVLLPILIFESSFRLESHALKANLAPVLILAIFGFLMSTGIIGGLMYWLLHAASSLREDWPEALCFAYGAMVSATDPVAVMSVLSEMGAPQRMKVVIEGESLLNDGAAILTFDMLVYVLQESINPGSVEWAEVIPLKILGVAQYMDDPLAYVLGTVYSIFVIAENWMEGSGVLTLAIFGIYVGSRRDQGSSDFDWVIVYEWSVFSRGIVFLFFRFINRYREARKKLTPVTCNKTYFFIAWAGLRGAVALLLALQLQFLHELAGMDPVVTDHVVLYAGLTVFLSLLVQGTTAAPLIRCLKLNERSLYRKARLGNILTRLRREGLPKKLQKFHREQFYFLAGANWKVAEKIASDALMPIEDTELRLQVADNENDENTEIPGLPPERIDPRLSQSFFRQAGESGSKDSVKFPAFSSEEEIVETYMHILLGVIHKLRDTFSQDDPIDMEKHRGLDIDHMIERARPSIPVVLLSRVFKYLSQKIIDWTHTTPLKYPKSRDWWCLASFFGILCVQCGFAVTVIVKESNNSFEAVQNILYLSFLLCLFSVLEQIVLSFPFQSQLLRNAESLWAYADFGFGILYLVLATVTGSAMKVTKNQQATILDGECFDFNPASNHSIPIGWKMEKGYSRLITHKLLDTI